MLWWHDEKQGAGREGAAPPPRYHHPRSPHQAPLSLDTSGDVHTPSTASPKSVSSCAWPGSGANPTELGAESSSEAPGPQALAGGVLII